MPNYVKDILDQKGFEYIETKNLGFKQNQTWTHLNYISLRLDKNNPKRVREKRKL